jgi:hypothetical protein
MVSSGAVRLIRSCGPPRVQASHDVVLCTFETLRTDCPHAANDYVTGQKTLRR